MKREIKYDILKTIGLLCIILAHVNPPKLIFQLRNFDVILMILISAYLGLKSCKNTNFFKYLKKRIYRLIVPTWFFLIFFFIVSYIFNLCNINLKLLVASFGLQGGIGYVWVIRIYFIISILVPIHNIVLNKSSNVKYYLFLVILYIGYEILCNYGIFKNIFINYFFAYIIPCYCLIALSKILFESNNKKLLVIAMINLVLFILIGSYLFLRTGKIQPTQIMKYPFRLYYLSYGIFISSILILVTNNNKICVFLDNKIISFISNNSLWIYLWHILAIFFLNKININWFIKYILILSFSLVIVCLQSKLISKVENDKNKNIIKIFKG